MALPLAAATSSTTAADNGAQGNHELHLLSVDVTSPIAIGMKAMFEKTMSTLEVGNKPLFKQVPCPDGGSMFTIKMDTTNLPSVTGRRVLFSIAEGAPSLNPADAEASAVEKAFKLLQSNHLIRIVDFSTMLVQRVVDNDSHGMLSQAIDAFEKVIVQWDVAVAKCESFEEKLEKRQLEGNIYAPRNPRASVFGSLFDYLSEQRCSFIEKTIEAKNVLTEARHNLGSYQLFLEEKSKTPNDQPPREANLGSTFFLEHVMKFFNLPRPQYVSKPRGYGVVESTVTIVFPEMESFHVSGSIELQGKSYSTAEANEEAAFEALKFIEENFNTKIVDYNYSQRKKSLKEEGIIASLLSDVLDHSDTVKMLFGELTTAVEAQRLQFSFDPTLIFKAHMSAGQIDAYHYCSRGLAVLAEDLAKCYAACAQDFLVMNNLTWKLFELKCNRLE